jgi:transcriptional regulator with XRE-family HTH domain
VKLILVVAKNLLHYRKRANLTQEQLGWKAGLHPTYLGRVERGEDTISVNNLEKLAKALKIQPNLLLIADSWKKKANKSKTS